MMYEAYLERLNIEMLKLDENDRNYIRDLNYINDEIRKINELNNLNLNGLNLHLKELNRKIKNCSARLKRFIKKNDYMTGAHDWEPLEYELYEYKQEKKVIKKRIKQIKEN